MMKSIKKRILLLAVILITVLSPLTSYAAAPTQQTYTKSQYADMVRNLITNYFDPSSKDYEIGMKIADGIEDHYDELEKDPTCNTATNIIGEITTDAFGKRATGIFADSDATLFYSQWKNLYLQEAESLGISTVGAYGVSLSSLFADLGINPLGYNSTPTEQLSDKSKSINVLTWNNKVDATGATYRDVDQGKISELLTMITTQFGSFMSLISTIAVALTIAFGCGNLLQMTSDRSLSTEALTREFLKMLVGVWLVLNYRYFALLIIRIGTLINEMVLTTNLQAESDSLAAPLLVSTVMKIINANAATGISSIQVSIVTGSAATVLSKSASDLLIPKLLNALGSTTIVQTALQFAVYVVAIEIGIRYVFTPIAIADLYSEKYRSNGFMWLKKLLAVTIQGALIFLVMYGSTALKQVIGGMGGAKLAINCATLGMFAGSKLIANEIVGVR